MEPRSSIHALSVAPSTPHLQNCVIGAVSATPKLFTLQPSAGSVLSTALGPQSRRGSEEDSRTSRSGGTGGRGVREGVVT